MKKIKNSIMAVLLFVSTLIFASQNQEQNQSKDTKLRVQTQYLNRMKEMKNTTQKWNKQRQESTQYGKYDNSDSLDEPIHIPTH